MKLLIKSIIITLLFTISLSSCKKYPDGPSISLRTKKHRLIGEYSLEKYTLNGTDKTDFLKTLGGPNYMFHIEKDGTYHVHGNLDDEGKWEFTSDKKSVLLTSLTAGSTEQKYEILKLENKNIWLKHTLTNGDVEEYHWTE